MAIPVFALAKLHHLIFAASRSSSPAAVSCLVWPFLLRLATSCDRVWRGYPDAVYASRLFLFQLRWIVLPPGGGGGPDRAAGTRWERALQLVCRRLIGGWQSTAVLVDEGSFHTVSILAL